MVEIRLGDRYAKSIYELAEERNEVEQVRADFQLIDAVVMQNRDFKLMLASPVISTGKKSAIISEVFKGKLSTITDNLLQNNVRKKREKYHHDIAARCLALSAKRDNILRGTLGSAHELSADQTKTIVDIIEKELKTNFQLVHEVDPDLIGGFNLRIGDKLFEGSIASRLRDLEQQFQNNPYLK